MLHVAVEHQHVVGAEPRQDGPSRCARLALASRVLMPEHQRAGGFRQRRRLVGRAIVHDNGAYRRVENAVHHLSNRSSFVQRRNQCDDVRHHACLSGSKVSSAGSTSTDAAISATTLTTETTPIDCSGG